MANTKKLDQASRIKAKREQRHKNKELFRVLTDEQKRGFLKFEGGGFKKYLAALAKETAAAAAQAKPAAQTPAS